MVADLLTTWLPTRAHGKKNNRDYDLLGGDFAINLPNRGLIINAPFGLTRRPALWQGACATWRKGGAALFSGKWGTDKAG